MSKAVKIVGGLLVGAGAIYGIVKGVSFYNKAKNAINNIQFLFSFVRVHGLIGEGISKYTSPVLQVIFLLQLKNLSDFDITATNVVATIQSQDYNSTSWSTIAISEKSFSVNAVKNGGSSKTQLAINFKGLSTLSSIANMNSKKYRALITYQYKGTSLEYVQDIPLQQYLRLTIDGLKKSLGLRGLENNTLQLAG